jgi:hypothetical protein
MENAIVNMFISLKLLIAYTIEDKDDHIYNIIYNALKTFHQKIETIYFQEVLLKKMKLHIIYTIILITLHKDTFIIK